MTLKAKPQVQRPAGLLLLLRTQYTQTQGLRTIPVWGLGPRAEPSQSFQRVKPLLRRWGCLQKVAYSGPTEESIDLKGVIFKP